MQTETWPEHTHTHSFVHTTVFVHSTLQECKCMSSQWAGDALYTVKVIWADSTGRAPTVWLPHGGPGCHRNRPTSHDSSACQPGQSLTLLGNHPGKVDRKRKKLCGHGNSIHRPVWHASNALNTRVTYTWSAMVWSAFCSAFPIV